MRSSAAARIFIATVLVGAVSCSTDGPTDAQRAGEAAFKKAVSAYVVEFLRRNPTTNTYLGGAGLDPSLVPVDGMLRDYSPAAIDNEDQWLTATSQTLDGISPADLSVNSRIDRDVALAQIRFMLHLHQVRRYQERALDTYVGEPFRAIDWQLQGMTKTGDKTYGTAAEWTLVANRVRAIPQFLTTAKNQLLAGVKADHVPDRRMLERDGLNTSSANAAFFGETLLGMARDRIAGPDRDELLADLKSAGDNAASAYRGFHDFIQSTFFDSTKPPTVKTAFAADRFAMGDEEYDWATKNNFKIDTPAAALFEQAWPIVQTTQVQMVDLARRIGRQRGWTLPEDGAAAVRWVFDELSKDYPKSDEEMVAWYHETALRLVDYARKTGIFDVPADYQLEVVPTPPPLEASIDGAAYYAAPPFKNNGVGRFYVASTHGDVAALQSNNRASLADLAAHEGFPGHDWHFKVMTLARDQIAPVRWLTPGAVEDSSAMWEDSLPAEGWGLYAEALMAEPLPGGPPDGFYTPEEHLYQLQGKLYRDLRVRIDTGIHTGRLSYDDAVSLFSDVVDFLPGPCDAKQMSDAKRASCASAERAIFRYSKWPTQAITYRLGKDQIYALREEAAKRMGAAFSAKAFHLLFMKQGTIPSAYFRDSLLASLQPPGR